MNNFSLNLGWENRKSTKVKKVGLRAYMQHQIAVQPSNKKK